MSTLFPERQEAVKVLYEAAARLLDNAAQFDLHICREINRNRSKDCVELAEKIARMGPVEITYGHPESLEIGNTPFDLGYTLHAKDEIDDKG